jgi:hypothetical protein
MMTEFTINSGDYDNDILNVIGQIYTNYTGKSMSVKQVEGDEYTFISPVEIDVDAFKQYIRDNHRRCKEKRLERAQMTKCEVYKIGDDYYIVDGDTKVKIK